MQATKLHAPRIRDGALRRPRLTNWLREARPSLVLIVAPPGFGKTTLLADWAETESRPFAWLAIDPQDNDRTVLWTYLAAALESVSGSSALRDQLAGAARDADPPAAVVAATESLDEDVVLVLDDYHFITDSASHDSVMRFVELGPSRVQVVIATRNDPPLAVARLRATGSLIELRTRDLQFSRDETEEFLNDSLELKLDDASVSTLHTRTEGWPAGLYLAYLSLRATNDRQGFLDSFGASNRHVMDYLTEQVLIALKPETLDFMLATSIVDKLSGSLADALTGESDSAQRLMRLERANVFISPLDERREWYRYHHLLAGLLRSELQRRSPKQVPELHQRAAAWYEQNDDPDRAVEHAAAAGDLDHAAKIVSESYLRMIEWGRIATIVRWLALIGPGAIGKDRRLSVVNAWTQHFLGNHAEGDRALAAAIQASGDGPMPDGASSIDATAALMRGAFPGGDVGAMLSAARRAYELEGGRDSPWRTTVHVLLGFALVRAGHYEEARKPLVAGAEMAMRSNLWMDAIGAETLLSRVDVEAGDDATAERLATEAVELADVHGLAQTPTGAYARAALAVARLRRGDPATAERLLADAMPLARAIAEPLLVAEMLIPLGQAQQAQGHQASANAAFREADAIIESLPDPGVLRPTRHHRAKTTPPALPLSDRELEVLVALSRGLSKREVAAELFVSYNTVHSHVRSIYRKLDVRSRNDAVSAARQRGLLA